MEENKRKTAGHIGKDFFPCYVLIRYILLKFYFCMFYLMYHFVNFCFVVLQTSLPISYTSSLLAGKGSMVQNGLLRPFRTHLNLW